MIEIIFYTAIVFLSIVILIGGIFWFHDWLNNHLDIELDYFPSSEFKIDVSGLRNTKTKFIQVLKESICEDPNYFLELKEITRAKEDEWRLKELTKIRDSKLFEMRKKYYVDIIEDTYDREKNKGVDFIFIRRMTVYKQVSYEKIAFKQDVVEDVISLSFEELENWRKKLEEYGYDNFLLKSQIKIQRNLMTKELREEIAERDNYTCQICGKYMPDGVGLHIDHIFPVSKGGRTESSNLQVLCSKCNGKKSDKILSEQICNNNDTDFI